MADSSENFEIQTLFLAITVLFVCGLMRYGVIVIAPEISTSVQIDFSFIGLYTALIYAGVCFSSVIPESIVNKFGPVRLMGICLVAEAVSMVWCLSAMPAFIVG